MIKMLHQIFKLLFYFVLDYNLFDFKIHCFFQFYYLKKRQTYHIKWWLWHLTYKIIVSSKLTSVSVLSTFVTSCVSKISCPILIRQNTAYLWWSARKERETFLWYRHVAFKNGRNVTLIKHLCDQWCTFTCL